MQSKVLIGLGITLVIIIVVLIFLSLNPNNETDNTVSNPSPNAQNTNLNELEVLDLELKPLNNSNQSGRVSITSTVHNKKMITITMNNPKEASQPASIQKGDCANIGKNIGMLVSLKNGFSETITTLDEAYFKEPSSIVIRESFAKPASKVSCVELPIQL